MDRKTIKTACRNCRGGCGALVTVEAGVAVKIAPDSESPSKKNTTWSPYILTKSPIFL